MVRCLGTMHIPVRQVCNRQWSVQQSLGTSQALAEVRTVLEKQFHQNRPPPARGPQTCRPHQQAQYGLIGADRLQPGVTARQQASARYGRAVPDAVAHPAGSTFSALPGCCHAGCECCSATRACRWQGTPCRPRSAPTSRTGSSAMRRLPRWRLRGGRATPWLLPPLPAATALRQATRRDSERAVNGNRRFGDTPSMDQAQSADRRRVRQIDAECLDPADRLRAEEVAAHLVGRGGSALDQRDRLTGTRQFDRGGRTGGTAPDDHRSGHRRATQSRNGTCQVIATSLSARPACRTSRRQSAGTKARAMEMRPSLSTKWCQRASQARMPNP